MKIGIIAGNGNLPIRVAEYAKKEGDVFICALNNEANKAAFSKYKHIWIGLGEVGKALDAFEKNKITHIVMAGGVKKPNFSSLKLDKQGGVLLAKITKGKLFGDNSVLKIIVEFLESKGFEVLGAGDLLGGLFVKKGILGKFSPDKEGLQDIEIGSRAINILGKLDIGQAVIVQSGIVLGVEAIEGTDELIKRCKKLSREKGKGVLIKMSKPGQESRADLPTIGIKTIQNVHKAGFKGIAIEAGMTYVLDKEKVITYTDKFGLFIKAI